MSRLRGSVQRLRRRRTRRRTASTGLSGFRSLHGSEAQAQETLADILIHKALAGGGPKTINADRPAPPRPLTWW